MMKVEGNIVKTAMIGDAKVSISDAAYANKTEEELKALVEIRNEVCSRIYWNVVDRIIAKAKSEDEAKQEV